nr:uncharacterized protein LOC109758764 [Aegilops tauschii subsp. strangulata]
MPSWNDRETSSEDECDITSMDMAIWETPDTTVESLFCGQLELSEPACMMHHMRPIKCVAFEGTLSGRRFYGCPEHANCGRVVDQQKCEKHLAKLKTKNDKLCIEYTKLVQDVSKMFDWQDRRVDHMDYQKTVEEEEFENRKKEVEESARLEVQMEKLKLAKEQRCILQSQADIIKNTRKAMKEVEEDKDLLKKEKAKLEHVVNELLKDGYASKEKMEKIKAILDS